MQKITLELCDDASGFEGNLETGLETLFWTIHLDGVEIGKLDNYEGVCVRLGMLFDIMEGDFNIVKKKDEDANELVAGSSHSSRSVPRVR